MATPHVSGAAALCASAGTKRGASLKSALLSLTAPTASLTGKTVTGGRLDLTNLVATCGGGGTPPPSGPSISGLTPGSGPVGTPVVVTGSGLAGATVQFGTTTVPSTVNQDGTSVSFLVPSDAAAGSYPVNVTVGTWSMVAGSFTVTVLPSQPQNLAWSKVNKSTARLSWSAPSTGAPILSYDVRMGTSGTWTNTTSTSINASRLRTGTTYTWQVRANNALGSGAIAEKTFTFG